jgi:hypothetical protein
VRVLRDGEDMNRPLTYVACAYSDDDPAIRLARFEVANRASGWLMRQGYVCVSPISHTHPIAECCELPRGWDFWRTFDHTYLALSCRIVVLLIDGWRESVGVQAEIAIARAMGIDVEYLSVNGHEFRFVEMAA